MSKYCVISLKGNQYKVSEGDELLVDLLGDEKPEPKVLLWVDGDKVLVGNSNVRDKKVKLKVIKETESGKKLHVMKYKAKSRYRKKIGFRPKYTRIKVDKFS